MNKMINPKISIITVVFNGEKQIKSTIESVLNQTYNNYEYIIIDGLSTDNTLKIVKTYKNIKWISEKDTGIYNAMNKGISLANGEIIGILNCGDLYSQKCLNDVIVEYSKAKLKHDDDFVISGGMLLVDYKNNSKRKLLANKSLLNNLNQRMTLYHPSIFVSNITYMNFGSFNESYKIAADYDLLLRFYNQAIPFYFSNKIFTEMDDSGVSTSLKGVLINLKESFIIRSKHINFFINIYQNIYELIGYFYRKFYVSMGSSTRFKKGIEK